MGRQKRQRKVRPSNNKPDECFNAGPLEYARFGKVVVGRTRATPEQLNAINKELADRLPDVISEIDATVIRIASRVAKLPPDKLLQRAWWELSALIILPSNGVGEFEQTEAMRMIDYVQSVIASVEPVLPYVERVEEEDWKELSKDVKGLFALLRSDYQFCRTSKLLVSEQNPDLALEDFRFRAETLWMNVRGERYHSHEGRALLELLTPHSDELVQIFGVDAPKLVAELEKILAKLTIGLGELYSSIEKLHEETLERMGHLIAESNPPSIEELHDMVFEDPRLAAQRDRVVGELYELDLFDVEKVTELPRKLLDEISWSPGEEREFFAEGEFRGWPLRLWPTMKRPFIRLGERILCFDIFALFDNFYRVIQRVIFRLDPNYKEAWKERQKQVSETLPLEYLQRLLPGSTVWRSVFYRHKVGNSPARWYETDGLLAYDDHLFIVEVKAGSFTYTSPTTDLQAHLASLESLVVSPAIQGNRFVDYLESAREVPLFNETHIEIVRIRQSDYRHITVCAVTLDAFTELAARANQLKSIGVDVGRRPIWVLSIDDLRVYSDLFLNPLRFLHFVEQRKLAASSELVDLNDEMDHLGLYVENNNYSLHAAELVGSSGGKLVFDGYRKPIDDYYQSILMGEPADPPSQEMPPRLSEIIEFLANKDRHGRSKVTSFLLDCSGEYRREIADAIENAIQDNRSLRRIRPISTYGGNALTLFVWSPSVARDAKFALRHTQVVASAAEEKGRFLLELEYSSYGTLLNVHWQTIDLTELTAIELANVRRAGQVLRRERVSKIRSKGSIGRNTLCPCGSGKKFKRCCIRLGEEGILGQEPFWGSG